MSWDISIMDLPRDVRSVAEIPEDFKPRALGRRTELIDKIQSVVPTADFSDPSWGEIVGADFVIEVNIGRDEVVDSIMLHVRGGEAAVAVISSVLTHLDVRAIDMQTGDFFDQQTASASLAAWRAYRDRVARPID